MGRMLNSDDEGILDADTELLGNNLFAYCSNDPVNNSDPTGFWKLSNKWKIGITVGILALAAGVLIASGAGAPVGCLLLGVAQGAITGAALGATTGAATGAAMGAVGHRISTGSWKGAGRAALRDANQGMIDGAFSGAITGAITGGLTSRACFVAGTSVLTSSGLVAIENIKAGDMVYSENPETGEKSLKTVVQTFEKEVNKLIHVYVDGEEIKTTDEHPFWVIGKGWVGASHLQKGDKVKLQNDESVAVANVTAEFLVIPVKVYNFEVADWHTYFVSDASILVHNLCSVKNTSKLWDIQSFAKGTQKFNFKGKSMTAYMDKNGYYWAKDLAGHAKSAFKVFEKVGKELRWFADADKYGNFIVGKAKSAIGKVIKL